MPDFMYVLEDRITKLLKSADFLHYSDLDFMVSTKFRVYVDVSAVLYINRYILFVLRASKKILKKKTLMQLRTTRHSLVSKLTGFFLFFSKATRMHIPWFYAKHKT